jgi:hypothetical protein
VTIRAGGTGKSKEPHMAERANAASTAAAAVGDQKYLAAINIMKTDIARAKSQQSKAGGEASQAYTRIEKLGVNKKAATFIASLLNTEASIAEDVLRGVINLATAADIMPKEDLVDLADRMANAETGGRSARRPADDTGGDDGQDGDDDDDADAGDGAQASDAGDGGSIDDADLEDEEKRDAAGDDGPVRPIHDTDDATWDAAGEAAAAAAKVGKKPTPAEARAARKANLRAVPDAVSSAARH